MKLLVPYSMVLLNIVIELKIFYKNIFKKQLSYAMINSNQNYMLWLMEYNEMVIISKI